CFFKYDIYCTPKSVDTILFFILSTVLTRSIASFFSADQNIKVVDIVNPGFYLKGVQHKHKFVFLEVTDNDQIDQTNAKESEIKDLKNDLKNEKDVEKLVTEIHGKSICLNSKDEF
ncbi:31295_t:CDS:2, partial [Racocetra persica]